MIKDESMISKKVVRNEEMFKGALCSCGEEIQTQNVNI